MNNPPDQIQKLQRDGVWTASGLSAEFKHLYSHPHCDGIHRVKTASGEHYAHEAELVWDCPKNAKTPEARGSAFEMVDATDDERYFPLGVWFTLEAAIAALDECKDPDDLGSDGCHDDYAKVEIRQRAIGWSGHGKKVYQREWSQKYDEAKDEYEWHVMPNA